MAKTLKENKPLTFFILIVILIYGCEFEKNNSKNEKLFKVEKDVFTVEGEKFINQKKIFNKNGELDSTKSKFYNLKINDTLTIGPNKGFIELYTYNKPYEYRNSAVILKNFYPGDSTSMDTFNGKPRNIEFGIYASQTGNKKIKGKILEYIAAKNAKDSLILLKLTSYFQKNVQVIDTIK